MADKEHTTLYTIFNRNDPSPTASALKNHDYDSAVIFILGEMQFNKKHRTNLSRFKTWILGSAKNHGQDDVANQNYTPWPDIFWKKQWDWPSLSNDQISFISSDNITDKLLDTVQANDIFDLTSGTKGQCADLIQKIGKKEISVNLSLQTRDGNSLNLTDGTLTKNNSPLSFRERVWLSSGYIVDHGKTGNRIRGEKLAKIQKSVKISNQGVKIIPNDKALSKIFKVGKVNLSAGFWLEEVTTNMMSNWPQIDESYVGPRLIHSSFNRAAGASFNTLSNIINRKSRKLSRTQKMFENQLEIISKINAIDDYDDMQEAALSFFKNTEFSKEQIDKIVACLHSVEFDAVAFDNNSGNVFTCECKAMIKVDPGVLGRINSITKLVFPTYGTPVLVYSGAKSLQREGVNLISWPMLEDSKIIQRLQDGETLNYKAPDSSKDNPTNKEIIKEQKKIIPIEDRVNILRSTLEYVRYNPMPWPLFIEMLSSAGYGKVTGLYKGIRRKRYGKKLAEEMGFVINAADTPSMQAKLLQSVDWITWKESISNDTNTKETITENSDDKLKETIQIDDKDIIEIINDYYQSSDLFTKISIDDEQRTINIKSAQPGRVIGSKGKHSKSVVKTIKKKLGVVFRIHIVK